MPKQITPPVQPVSVMEDFTSFLKKYSDFDVFLDMAQDKARTEAEADIQGDLIDQLMTEIENGFLVTCECELDCSPSTDNLREWLTNYYRLEEK